MATKLDINTAWAWPLPIKLAACALVAVVVAGLGTHLMVRDQWAKLEKEEKKERDLKKEFEEKAGRAAHLEPLKKQLADLEDMLKVVVRQLPSRTQMAETIVDLTQISVKHGITSELFQPGDERPKDFYAEKPIKLNMRGDYHQFGAFVSDVAQLPRVVILTMDGVSLKVDNPDDPASQLRLEGTLNIYRYLDDEEIAANAPVPTVTEEAK